MIAISNKVHGTILHAMLGAALFCGAAMTPVAQAQGAQAPDAQIQSEVNHQLDNKRFRGVTATVQNGVVTLTGTVSSLQDKLEATRKVQKIKTITQLNNRVSVSDAAQVSDEQIAQKLSGKLSINPTNPDRTAFEFINMRVQDGVVTLTGLVIFPDDKSEAEGIVASQAGVKDLVDHIVVAPPSPNDDRIRRDVYRAIYGYSTFTRYAINPVKPIRILVLNGNVTLAGVVDSQSDKEQAYLRANGVGGVFKVTNDLQVAGQNEK
jgi:osmotically-inducible protein OsmY